MPTMVAETPQAKPAFGSPESRRLGSLANARKAEARRSLIGSGPEAELRAIRSKAISQMTELVDRCEKAIRALTPDRAADHRALASTLIALSERVDAALEAERRTGQAVESYEQRLARAYREQGLPVPGRLGRGSREPAPDVPPSPPSGAEAMG